jgi:hypothetical protein
LINNLSDNDKIFWISKWFKKIPNAEDFAEWWFKRDDIMILIGIISNIIDTQQDWKDFSQFKDILNHFVRNWASAGCLYWDNERRKKTYSQFIYLINNMNMLDNEKKLFFLKRLEKIKYLHKQDKFCYNEWSNWIEVMVDEINIIAK